MMPNAKFRPPARFEAAKWEDVPKMVQEPVERLKQTKKGVYLHGGVGTGKTHVAYAVARYVHDDTRHLVKVINSANLMDDLRAEMDRPGSSMFTELLAYQGLIVIDDIGSEKLSEWVAERFYILINRKYEQMIPMFFTSNLSLRELSDRIGERTVSRIVEMCEVIELTGEDRRLR